jgi:hypothetical protein
LEDPGRLLPVSNGFETGGVNVSGIASIKAWSSGEIVFSFFTIKLELEVEELVPGLPEELTADDPELPKED